MGEKREPQGRAMPLDFIVLDGLACRVDDTKRLTQQLDASGTRVIEVIQVTASRPLTDDEKAEVKRRVAAESI